MKGGAIIQRGEVRKVEVTEILKRQKTKEEKRAIVLALIHSLKKK